MNDLILESPSKVNLILEIKGKRKDGYHELRTVMHTLALADKLTFKRNKTGLKVTCDHEGVPDQEGNLVFKAAEMIAEIAKKEPNVSISIKKKIPVAAGMGGGSSNAATALLGLAKLWKVPNTGKILKCAKALGSDVPFFLKGGCCLATGRGERLFPWTAFPDMQLAIINPGIPVSTAETYKKFNLRLTTKKACINMMRRAFEERNAGKVEKYLFNHLEYVTAREYSIIETIKQDLLHCGATAAMMTGSGPTVFGMVPSDKVARTIRKELGSRYPYVTVTRTTGSRSVS